MTVISLAFSPHLQCPGEVTFCKKHPAFLPTKKFHGVSECRSCNSVTLLWVIYHSHKENAVYSELISKLFSRRAGNKRAHVRAQTHPRRRVARRAPTRTCCARARGGVPSQPRALACPPRYGRRRPSARRVGGSWPPGLGVRPDLDAWMHRAVSGKL